MRKYNKIVEKENRISSSGRLKGGDSMKGGMFTSSQNQRVKELMEKKPLTSSITITALEDQQHQPNFPAFPSPIDQNEYFKKKSMMSPRFSEHPKNNPHKPQAQIKMSSIYQY